MQIEEVTTRTDRAYWEKYWRETTPETPTEISINPNKYTRGLYDIFRRFLEPGKPTAIAEIGGAPGLFIASLTKIHDQLRLAVIDYSDKGCAETKALSDRFNLRIEIHQRDVYSSGASDVPKYDIVYSRGVVEHYEDIDVSVDRHLEYTREGGLIIVGLPVFLGVNEWLADRLAPANKSTWYPAVMDNRSWRRLHDRQDIEVVADEYVGGFNPHVHHRLERKNQFSSRVLHACLHKYFARLWDVIPGTERINSKYFSFFYYFAARKRFR